MSKTKYIKIPLPNLSWWQYGFIIVMIIISYKTDISISDIIELLKLCLS